LIARASGMTFGGFLHERIFAPLGMKDTAFHVPQAKRDRFATSYVRDHATRKLKVFDDPVTGKFVNPPVFENGSAGLVSTADDFNAFAQMMLNGGRLGSERILSRPS
jgi:CubicO group peptidase (beta-lactamase class C family)